MKRISALLLFTTIAVPAAVVTTTYADEGTERPRENQRDREDQTDGDRRDGEPERRGPRDGDRREGDPERRGPRDGDRPGDRGPRDGDRHPPHDGPRDGHHRPPHGGPVLSALDTNHNGILESEEIDQAIRVLRRMDRNRDGQLTGDELHRPPEGGRPPRDGDRPPRDGDRPRGENDRGRENGGRPPEGDVRREGRPDPDQMRRHFDEADKNEDGKLSLDEAPERMKPNFGRLDRNEDGFVDKREFEAMLRAAGDAGGRPPRDGDDRGRRGGGERDGDRNERETERRRPEAE